MLLPIVDLGEVLGEKMKFWCLLLALGLIQVSSFMHAVEGRDTDGDGITDDSK